MVDIGWVLLLIDADTLIAMAFVTASTCTGFPSEP
jgi:hypothetical protein